MSLAAISFFSTTLLFITHWASIQFYAYYCAPPGFYGLITSFTKSPSPLCIGANYLQFYSIQLYYTLWISMILTFCKLLQEKLSELKSSMLETKITGKPDKSNGKSKYKYKT